MGDAEQGFTITTNRLADLIKVQLERNPQKRSDEIVALGSEKLTQIQLKSLLEIIQVLTFDIADSVYCDIKCGAFNSAGELDKMLKRWVWMDAFCMEVKNAISEKREVKLYKIYEQVLKYDNEPLNEQEKEIVWELTKS